MIWPAFVWEWGTTAAERERPYPCDRLLGPGAQALFRAVDVAAPAATTFRWLCQLRAAPYSYDLLDNLGRRSPQTLTPGLEQLAAGQRVMTIFELVEFAPGRSITLWSRSRLFGRVACTYCADPAGAERSRIVVKMLAVTPWVMRLLLPPGDLVMMRRQLLNLKALAEATYAPPHGPVERGARSSREDLQEH